MPRCETKPPTVPPGLKSYRTSSPLCTRIFGNGHALEGNYEYTNFDKADFLGFLIEAKRATYAAQGDDASVTPLIDGLLQLEYRSGHFFYRDIYFGMAYFVGQETIYHKNRPVWSMSYAGGVD